MRAGWLLIAGLLAACRRPPPTFDAACDAPDLHLERALPIAGELEPSGLLLDAGKLLMVADKHDRTIFELRLDAEEASVDERVKLSPTDASPLDLEGVAADRDGSWLLASEAQGRVLRVMPDGNVSWATASLRAEGADVGLFAKRGAGLGTGTPRPCRALAARRRTRAPTTGRT